MTIPNYIELVRAARESVIQKGINPDRDEASRAEVTFLAAALIHRVDPRAGLLHKDSGNRHRDRAVDIICFTDGSIFDCIGAGNLGPNTPHWMQLAAVSPTRWRAPFPEYLIEAAPPPPREEPPMPPRPTPIPPPIHPGPPPSGPTVVVSPTPAPAPTPTKKQTVTKGLLLASIRDPDPVIFMEPKRIYRAFKEEVPDGDQSIELGKADVVRKGDDMTIFAFGAMLHVGLEAAKAAEEDGVSVEVVDLMTLSPLDEEAVLASAKKTGRVLVLQEAPKFVSYGSEVSALIAEEAIEYLEAPIKRVAGFDTPFPYSLENVYLPSPNRVLNAIDELMEY